MNHKATVALANKLARFARAVATREQDFEARLKAAGEENATDRRLRRRPGDDDSVRTDAGIEPMTLLAFGAAASDRLPARGTHPGPEPTGFLREAVDTTALLPFVRNRAARYSREESGYERSGDRSLAPSWSFRHVERTDGLSRAQARTNVQDRSHEQARETEPAEGGCWPSGHRLIDKGERNED